MALTLNNVALADSFSDDATLGPARAGILLSVTVANASAFVQFKRLIPGGGDVEWGPELLVPPTSFQFANIIAFRARNAVAGEVARVIATLWEPSDPQPQGSTPFTQILAASGSVAGVVEVPVGSVVGYGGTVDPPFFLICNGRAISRTTYASLFAVLGTAYGAGDGSTTFNIPDLRGRTAVGLGTHVDVNALGDADAVPLADRRPAHNHTIRLNSGFDGGPNRSVQSTSGGFAVTETVTGAVGPVVGGANVPLDAAPFQVLNYIVATGVQ